MLVALYGGFTWVCNCKKNNAARLNSRRALKLVLLAKPARAQIVTGLGCVPFAFPELSSFLPFSGHRL